MGNALLRSRRIACSAEESSPLAVLAKHALAMLASSEDERDALMEHADSNRPLVNDLLEEFDASRTGQLEAPEAERLFKQLARQLLEEAARRGKGAAAAHARGLLSSDDASQGSESYDAKLGSTIAEMSAHLLRLADSDGDGVVSLSELADLFEGSSLMGTAGAGGDDPMAKLVDRPDASSCTSFAAACRCCRGSHGILTATSCSESGGMTT